MLLRRGISEIADNRRDSEVLQERNRTPLTTGSIIFICDLQAALERADADVLARSAGGGPLSCAAPTGIDV